VSDLSSSNVLAVVASDLHLSHTPPVYRSPEPDWYATQLGYLRQVRKLCVDYECPFVVAGDLFDKWNSPPELINWTIKNLKMPRGVYAVPGQHDLPHHRYEDVRKSAYWTLVEAGVIEDLTRETIKMVYHPMSNAILNLHGFPWGSEPEPLLDVDMQNFSGIHLAVVHDYCWAEGHTYPNADQSKNWKKHKDNFCGFHALAFGDNHKGFVQGRLVNCGGFTCRNSDEFNYKPAVYLLDRNAKFHTISLNIEEDFTLDTIPAGKLTSMTRTVHEFMDILEGLGKVTGDYPEACRRYMRAKKIPDDVQRMVLSFLESPGLIK